MGMEINPNDRNPFHVEAATVILPHENIRIQGPGRNRHTAASLKANSPSRVKKKQIPTVARAVYAAC
jgi:hypothetical protein